MQTSGNGSFSTTRVAGMAAAFGLAIAMTGNWLACSPGEPDCTRVECGGSGGGINAGGAGDTGGAGGATGGGGGVTYDDPPAECGSNVTGKGAAALTAFETKFISVRCGVSMCHKGASAPFSPKNLDSVAAIRPAIAGGQKGSLYCKTDAYVNKSDPSKSYILAKIDSDNAMSVTCPSGGAGGTRMPNKTDPTPMPVVPGDKLMDDEITCFTWYINQVAKTAK